MRYMFASLAFFWCRAPPRQHLQSRRLKWISVCPDSSWSLARRIWPVVAAAADAHKQRQMNSAMGGWHGRLGPRGLRDSDVLLAPVGTHPRGLEMISA